MMLVVPMHSRNESHNAGVLVVQRVQERLCR